MHILVTTLLCLVASYALFVIVNRINSSRFHRRRAQELGCKPIPVKVNKLPLGIDQVWELIQADKRNEVPTEILRILREVGHPTVEMRVMGDASIMTTDPKNIQAILATQFDDFELGKRRNAYFYPLLGHGIFTADGKFWSHSRAILRPQFSRDQVSDLGLLETHVQLMLKHLQIQPSGWTQDAELSAIFFRLTMDSATEFLFGQSACSQIAALPPAAGDVPSQEGKPDDLFAVGRAFDAATHALGIRARLGPLYYLHSPKIFRESCKIVHKFADHYVQLALEEQPKSIEDGTGSDHSTGKYVFLHELVKSTRDPVELRSQLLNILLAGRDTTAGLLGWTFWVLARHPEIYEKLRATIIETFGNYDTLENITFSSLKACTYLQHVMNEVLRLYPSVPTNNRAASRDTTLPHGGGPDGLSPIYIRKSQQVAYSVHVMHRRKDLWGEDAEEFKPERWVNAKHGWQFLPFNGGPRICLGQQYALTEAGYVIVRILQRFDRMENLDTTKEVKFQYSVTSAPLSVKVRLHCAGS